ncbi:hypothetical protein [Streptomyces sp. NPDC046805]|uniref:hypothetical protein n=1 Tax=Streptomyces sp. NPDC046805 TaxID=3155134 RepID=UPI0033E24FD8
MSALHPSTARSGVELRILRAAVFAAVCVVLAAAGHTLASCAGVPPWTLGAGFLGSFVLVAPLAGRTRSLPGIVAVLALGQTVLHTLFGLGQSGTAALPFGDVAMRMPMGMPMGSPGATGAMTSMASMEGMASMGGAASTGGAHDAALVEQAARFVCGTGMGAITPAHAYRILSDAHIVGGPGMGAMSHAGDATGSSASLLPTLPMLLGHLLAAIAVGWLLRRGDLAVLRLIELSAHGVAEGACVRSLRWALALVRALYAGLPAEPRPAPRRRRTAQDDPPAPHTTALQHTVIRRGPPARALALAA